MLNDKNCCIRNIYGSFVRSSKWRAGLAERFKNDPRNKRAADTLDRLSLEIKYFTDEQWQALQPFYSWDSAIWAESVSNAARQVEFRHDVTTLPEFLQTLLTILEEHTSLGASSLATSASDANTAVSA
jgi:hypothetical protein